MPRRKRRSAAPPVSLFPFLSILACVIGTLTLMITAMALGQMDEDEIRRVEEFYQQQVQRLARHEQLQKQLAADREALAEWEAQLAEARDLAERRATLQAQLERMEAARKSALADQSRAAQLQVRAHETKLRIDDLTRDLARVRKEKTSLETELAKRKKPPPEAVVTIRPGGSGQGLDPRFVECRAREVVLHQGKTPTRIPRADLDKNEAFGTLLADVAGGANKAIVFLVRTNGITTYAVASRLARYARARNGKLPVLGQGQIDLSLFRQR